MEAYAERVAEEVNEEIRLNGRLVAFGDNYSERQVDIMAVREAKSICPEDIDFMEVADLAQEFINYDYCGD